MNWFAHHAPSIALVFFFVTFVVIAVRAYRPSAKKTLQEQAMIPLREDSHE